MIICMICIIYLYVWGEGCMGRGMYGERDVWGEVCMGRGMYGVRYVWDEVCVGGEMCLFGYVRLR